MGSGSSSPAATPIEKKVVYYWRQGKQGEPRVLIDPNTLSADGSVSVKGLSVSWTGEKAAYKLSRNNADRSHAGGPRREERRRLQHRPHRGRALRPGLLDPQGRRLLLHADPHRQVDPSLRAAGPRRGLLSQAGDRSGRRSAGARQDRRSAHLHQRGDLPGRALPAALHLPRLGPHRRLHHGSTAEGPLHQGPRRRAARPRVQALRRRVQGALRGHRPQGPLLRADQSRGQALPPVQGRSAPPAARGLEGDRRRAARRRADELQRRGRQPGAALHAQGAKRAADRHPRRQAPAQGGPARARLGLRPQRPPRGRRGLLLLLLVHPADDDLSHLGAQGRARGLLSARGAGGPAPLPRRAGDLQLQGRHAGHHVHRSPPRPEAGRLDALSALRLRRLQHQPDPRLQARALPLARAGRRRWRSPTCAAAASTARPGTRPAC